ncbi:putative O-acyltransferase, WSD1, O-acyltransferase WSD1 [Helianthus annuus]|uniref:O-acyltransferase, WSD1, O-acyltransferase WSD1 n=1 Tax=Helianthus annuus TaxID=4232 RepID=A0A251V4G0_HELAN|nr:O-acyltransferase WSD1 [Helianthus annuus]KAF5812398.1 putative O-acyltransferase, WSD1, O-acyltransferase WSD1 [Helianthus annuus]KAJ0582960.1 putative O-acyltransferase, WSD1, O-acyltransferase WSD1 [Helianthus annuus]KAJ0598939.1 putative O-acyltransferase, WSD1, O-acyltransferase WSD1 [Helianthus annuus]KAJ0933516.1 putative O-acyltransferase, WSD1, O-acyltransferase WSD1 [Helianthus annuus]
MNDEPLSPAGRLFVQPATHQIINCTLGLEQPLSLDAAKHVVSNSLMIQHPRFSSLLVTDNNGREYWRKTELNIDRHIILRPDPIGEAVSDEAAINDYVADLTVSSPLSYDKPLWEIHLLPAHKCVVLRIHHALGDGISLMSLMLTLTRKLDDPDQTPAIEPLVSSKRKRNENETLGEFIKVLKMICFSLIYVIEFIMRGVWVNDGKTVVRGGEGVEMWPRKLVTARFRVEDMKTVKNAVSDATINDVLFGVISLGLSKYLGKRSPDSLQEGLRITGVALVNLRPSPGLQDIKELMKKNAAGTGWGNKIGIILLPVYYHRNGSDPLQYLKRAKTMLDRKKLSLEAVLSHQIGHFVMKFFGAKVASMLNYRVVCNTSFTISNVVGPREDITIAGIPVTYMRTTSSALSHAITMHMLSYSGKADMQILVAKDLIPDPENLAKCFEDALLEMKEASLQI